jgi:glycosyltransferase involved in cell wall biosynthesis
VRQGGIAKIQMRQQPVVRNIDMCATVSHAPGAPQTPPALGGQGVGELGVPVVSVVIPCHNGEELLRAAIGSVAAQSFASLEIIIVDDASTDNTLAVAQAALAESGRAGRVVRNATNLGPAAARNAGVRAARGEFVAFLDSDDIWLPEKIERQVALMRADPHVTLCGCQAIWIEEGTGRAWPLFRDLPVYNREGWRMLLWQTYVATPCAMVRRADLGIAPFDVGLRVAEDRDLWFKLASNGTVALVQEPMVHIRVSQHSYMAQNVQLVREHTVPVVRRNLTRFADRLTLREKMLVHARIHSELGRSMADLPQGWPRAAGHLVLASVLGNRPVENLAKLCVTAPMLQFIINPLRRLRRRRLSAARRTALGARNGNDG